LLELAPFRNGHQFPSPNRHHATSSGSTRIVPFKPGIARAVAAILRTAGRLRRPTGRAPAFHAGPADPLPRPLRAQDGLGSGMESDVAAQPRSSGEQRQRPERSSRKRCGSARS
jgi:hypothetical protein